MIRIFLVVFFSACLSFAQVANPTSTPSTDASSRNTAASLSEEIATSSGNSVTNVPPAYSSSRDTAAETSSVPGSSPIAVNVTAGPQNVSQRCWAKEASSSECKVHWGHAVGHTWEFLGVLAAGSLAKDAHLRETTFRAISNGQWTERWINSASNYWFTHWDQSSPWKDTYLGHPYMGAISQAIWVQDDPYGQTMQWDNSKEYWKSRLRALPLTVATSFEWKMGPVSEASLGNSGFGPNKGLYWEPNYHRWSNDTGLGPIVTTPVGGFLWFWGEDVLDKHLMPKLEGKSHNPIYLFAISFVTPAHGFANLLRFKAPWYRQYRTVKANW